MKQGKHDFCFLPWKLPWYESASCYKVSIIHNMLLRFDSPLCQMQVKLKWDVPAWGQSYQHLLEVHFYPFILHRLNHHFKNVQWRWNCVTGPRVDRDCFCNKPPSCWRAGTADRQTQFICIWISILFYINIENTKYMAEQSAGGQVLPTPHSISS